MSIQHYCPNCNAAVLSTAQDCTSCKASFSDGSTWKPVTNVQAEHPPATGLNLALAALGIALLVATFFPLGTYVLQAVAGGMYGPTFKPYSPALFIFLSYTANYLPLALLAWLLLRYFKVMQRVPYQYRGSKLFGFGVFLILFYSAVRVLAAMVPGGGAGFVVASLSPFIVLPALALLVIAVIRLCVGYGKGSV